MTSITTNVKHRVRTTGTEHQGQISISDPDQILEFTCIFSSGMQEIYELTLHTCSYMLLQDNTIVAFFSQRSGSVETFGSNDYISYEIECSDIADSGVDRTVSNLLGAT